MKTLNIKFQVFCNILVDIFESKLKNIQLNIENDISIKTFYQN